MDMFATKQELTPTMMLGLFFAVYYGMMFALVVVERIVTWFRGR